jgi:hypothetical protein
VVAGGGWTLRTLSLRACVQVSDTGIAAMLPLCSQLQSLNISDCPRVGEYGDKALIALGKHCSGLLKLEALGCQHVQGAGLSALAQVKSIEHIFNTSFYRYIMISSVRTVSMAKRTFLHSHKHLYGCAQTARCVLADSNSAVSTSVAVAALATEQSSQRCLLARFTEH